jgi:hypothetical protein
VLFMPGSNARALEKARTLAADVLILDLEDAVAPEMKLEARIRVAAAVRTGGYGHREVVVRANALATPWGRDDLVAAAAAGADAVLLPKVEAVETVSEAIAALGLGPAVWCMLETPRGILNAAAIAAASRRVNALVMGHHHAVTAGNGVGVGRDHPPRPVHFTGGRREDLVGDSHLPGMDQRLARWASDREPARRRRPPRAGSRRRDRRARTIASRCHSGRSWGKLPINPRYCAPQAVAELGPAGRGAPIGRSRP